MSSNRSSRPELAGRVPDDLSTLWETLDFDARTIRSPVKSTIRPPEPAPVPVAGESEEGTVTLHVKEAAPQIRALDLEILDTIGEGGMGLVRLARQVSLKREVAVKTVQPAVRDQGEKLRALSQEALITGALEHPNVIPVYALGQDSGGAPLIVMKRVEGVSWREFLEGERSIPEGTDALEWHLDVLLQVANALSFAHSRGIIHRDVKPENVMIGSFGEVYLLDWGLALSLRPEHRGTFPLASEARGVAGTPVYMSPEMVTGDGALLGPHTDVYLLGATLHEIVTGEPRHTGDSFLGVMQSAYASQPYGYGPNVPRELAELCNRATSREPGDRHGSVEEFRAALTNFLRHRTSIQLSNEAEERLSRMQRLLQEDTPEIDRQVRDLFGESRFGFEQALKTWPENVDARRGVEAAKRAMAEHELRQGNLNAARALVATVEGERGDLEAAVAELERRIESERLEIDRLREAAHQTDPTLRARGRAIAALVCGTGAGGSLVLIEMGERTGLVPLTPATYFLGWGVVLVLSVALLFRLFRRHLFVNQITTQIAVASVTAIVSILGFRGLVYMAELPLDLAFRFELILYGLALAMLGVVSNYRVLAAIPICIVGGVVDGFIAGDGLLTVAAAIFLAFVAVAWAWATTPPS